MRDLPAAEIIANDGEVYINSRSEEDHGKVDDIIRDLTWVSDFNITGPKADVIGTEAWKQFVQEIGTENCAVYDKVSFRHDCTFSRSRFGQN